ncbi:MAG: type I methionyl aminopeptidase [Actinomycetota bacterium]|nr:type I methionyl aminopeptidase [Actinomycetota bacterium]
MTAKRPSNTSAAGSASKSTASKSTTLPRIRSNDPCWCGSGRKHKRCHGDVRVLQRPRVEIGTVSPPRPVPESIVRPDYVASGEVSGPRRVHIHDEESLARHRRACQVGAEVLLRTGAAVAPGVTTEELDEIAHETYVELGAYPSTLHYNGYTKSICTSVNGVVCHGIPDDRPLREGDIVNVDVTAYIDGMHGDNSATFCVGKVDEPTRALVETTREATLRGIAAIRPHEPLQLIAEAIEPFARSRGFGVVREYGGHGIGAMFHGAPHVNHCIDRTDDTILVPGTTITVEPMLTSGDARFFQADDGWTEHVVDNMPSAQFEHTVLVTEDGVEILTVTADGETAVGTLADLDDLSA